MNIVRVKIEGLTEYWEDIKVAIAAVTKCTEKQYRRVMVSFLSRLLAGTMVCWVLSDDKDIPKAIIITEEYLDNGLPTLLLSIVYSFIPMTPLERAAYVEEFKKYAKVRNIVKLKTYSNIPPVWAMLEKNNFRQENRVYTLEV